MRTIFAAAAACLLIAVVADQGLDRIGFSSAERQTTPSTVRLD
jgi:hypothetical protein